MQRALRYPERGPELKSHYPPVPKRLNDETEPQVGDISGDSIGHYIPVNVDGVNLCGRHDEESSPI